MRFQLDHRSLKWPETARRAAMVLAACCVCGMASEAQASCGDYLLHRGMLGEMPVEVASAANETPMPVSHRPCRGPGCREAPPSSPSVPPPVEQSLKRDFVAFLSVSDPYTAGLSGRQVWESDRPLAGHILGILRPPNFA